MTSTMPDADEYWSSFLQNAIWGLEEAGKLLQTTERRHELEGRKDWFRSKNSVVPRENSVSRALADAFNVVRAQQELSSNGSSQHDLRFISIECEVPRPRDPGISDKAKPTDLRLLLLPLGNFDLRIEAKTVRNIRDLRNDYLGSEGIRRFENGENPYTISPHGGMAAYVLDADADDWRQKIKDAVAAQHDSAELPFRDKAGIERHTSVHCFDHVINGETKHFTVNVFHLVFEIEARPSLR
ncbi:hypothetical protein [Rhizobium oryziradicis]|uniref:Uncharacterized protein n=1 Tax=Rhizobium oryziradicis TaxID=1867956 RepID=A0A1Q8ZRT7_9HYPH|nr:hypothetical protein [Rhizobium oryziradicis]OLP44766.1 hypothetical protein BJF95_09820 [Rhizobium oryziradicis]